MQNLKLFLYFLLSVGMVTAQSSGDEKIQFKGFFEFQYNNKEDKVLLTIKNRSVRQRISLCQCIGSRFGLQ